MTTASELYDKAMSASLSVEEVCSAEVLGSIQSQVEEKKEAMTMRTARLWVQYLNMVDILRKFLKAVYDMLPYFAASGH